MFRTKRRASLCAESTKTKTKCKSRDPAVRKKSKKTNIEPKFRSRISDDIKKIIDQARDDAFEQTAPEKSQDSTPSTCTSKLFEPEISIREMESQELVFSQKSTGELRHLDRDTNCPKSSDLPRIEHLDDDLDEVYEHIGNLWGEWAHKLGFEERHGPIPRHVSGNLTPINQMILEEMADDIGNLCVDEETLKNKARVKTYKAISSSVLNDCMKELCKIENFEISSYFQRNCLNKYDIDDIQMPQFCVKNHIEKIMAARVNTESSTITHGTPEKIIPEVKIISNVMINPADWKNNYVCEKTFKNTNTCHLRHTGLNTVEELPEYDDERPYQVFDYGNKTQHSSSNLALSGIPSIDENANGPIVRSPLWYPKHEPSRFRLYPSFADVSEDPEVFQSCRNHTVMETPIPNKQMRIMSPNEYQLRKKYAPHTITTQDEIDIDKQIDEMTKELKRANENFIYESMPRLEDIETPDIYFAPFKRHE